MTGPDLLEHDPAPTPGSPLRRLLLLAVVAAVVGVAVVRGVAQGHRPPTQPPLSPPPVADFSVTALVPSFVVRFYSAIARLTPTGRQLGRLPAPPGGAPTSPTADDLGLLDSDGRRAYLIDPALGPRARADLGPATAVLAGAGPPSWIWLRTSAGLVRAVDPDTRRAALPPVSVPRGWHLESVIGDGVLVLTQQLDGHARERIALLAGNGRLSVLTPRGYYLGAETDGVDWLDPGCPETLPCRLHRGLPGAATVTASPPGTRFTPGPAAATGTGWLAVFTSAAGERGLAVVPPAPGSVREVPGSGQASFAAGLTWYGDALLFGRASDVGESGVQPMVWDQHDGGPSLALGPPLPPDARLVCVCVPARHLFDDFPRE